MADPKYTIGQVVSFDEFEEGTGHDRSELDWFGKGEIVGLEEEGGRIVYTLRVSEIYDEVDDDGKGVDNFADDIDKDYVVYESEITGVL